MAGTHEHETGVTCKYLHVLWALVLYYRFKNISEQNSNVF